MRLFMECVKMINIATVGTSWITSRFIEAIQLTDTYHLRGVYSRSAKKAEKLATQYSADYYCNELNNILFDPEIKCIYIANPNAKHFETAMRALRAGKHLIVEKPIFSNLEEWEEAFNYAHDNQLFIFEAVLHTHNKNYKRLKQFLATKKEALSQPFMGANFNIGQYSSKYPQYVDAMNGNGEVPNIFNPEMSAGTLMDIGVYPIYVMIGLFGMPKSVTYHTLKGENHIDLFGTAIFSYGTFQTSIFMSKAVHSELKNEIYLGDETIVIDAITRISKVSLINKAGQTAVIAEYQSPNLMLDEVEDFAEVLNHPTDDVQLEKYKQWTSLSYQVARVMQELRRSANG